MDSKTMQDFEDFIESQPRKENIIGVGHSVSELTGEGMEFLVNGDEILAKFYNGNLVKAGTQSNSDPNDPTVTLA